MHSRIHKFVMRIDDMQVIDMPVGAQVLSVANQDGQLCLWALVDIRAEYEGRAFEVIGTGNPIREASRTFIGTVLMKPFVWHVFERH